MRKCVCVASRVAFACAVYGASLVPAAAADLGGYPSRRGGPDSAIYVPSYFSWTGFYFGGQLGYGGGSSTSKNDPSAGTGHAFDGNYNQLSLTPNGFLGAGQLGYNWQSDSFVFGLEGDLGYLGASDDKYEVGGFAKAEYGWYSTAAARIGFSELRWLFYAKGGLALASIKNEAGAMLNGVAVAGDRTSLDDLRVGWALGAGTEFAFQRNWSMKVEYLFMDFGEEKSGNADGDVFLHDNSVSTIKVGINYRPQPAYEPLR